VATPDGMEIINLGASILMAISLLPYGVKLIKESRSNSSAPIPE
jgi:hypothetical protein